MQEIIVTFKNRPEPIKYSIRSLGLLMRDDDVDTIIDAETGEVIAYWGNDCLTTNAAYLDKLV